MIQIPTIPDDNATEAERREFDDACRVADLQLRAEAIRQADESKAHRDRMAAATEANGAALRAVADKTDSLADRKIEAVFQLLSTQARGNRKPETFEADVRAQVDAVFGALGNGGPTSAGT